MELGYKDATITVVALGDTTTSIYFSTGTILMGGGDHASIRKAGKTFIEKSAKYLKQMAKVKTYPLPGGTTSPSTSLRIQECIQSR